ncbi:MAG: threonylcarbamoyl-AMP synthase [Kiritimatiellae bacterium]|nr:threonylcarbamoyl-AMP synthase [Kiritimatiellia bacterium]
MDERAFNQARQILNAGGVVVFPTDTVYGIGARPDQPAAIRRIQEIKRRDAGKPIALLVSDAEAPARFGAELPPAAQRLAKRFWPGALTLVLPVRGGYEGFRVPNHPLAAEIIRAGGGLLRVTSANRSGEPPALTPAEAFQSVGRQADLMINGGDVPGVMASTVVKVRADNSTEILREGAIPRREIEAALKDE